MDPLLSYRPEDRQDCVNRYGPISFDPDMGLIWREAAKWVLPLAVPEGMKLKLFDGKPIHRIFCNKDIHSPLTKVFQDLIWTGLHTEIKAFDGCFNVRWIRGRPGAESMHSWAIALDFNAHLMPLGVSSKWSKEFVEIWLDAGWKWGGDFKRLDCMHFEWTGPQK